MGQNLSDSIVIPNATKTIALSRATRRAEFGWFNQDRICAASPAYTAYTAWTAISAMHNRWQSPGEGAALRKRHRYGYRLPEAVPIEKIARILGCSFAAVPHGPGDSTPRRCRRSDGKCYPREQSRTLATHGAKSCRSSRRCRRFPRISTGETAVGRSVSAVLRRQWSARPSVLPQVQGRGCRAWNRASRVQWHYPMSSERPARDLRP